MIPNLSDSRRARPSWIDRTWAGHYSVLSLSPIEQPDIARLKADLLELMASDPANPVNCVLSTDGRRWMEVEEATRVRHLDSVVIATGPFDTEDPYDYLRRYAPDPTSGIPYKVLVGPDSLTCYIAHVLGDAVVVCSFAVLLALGDVHGLRHLRPDSGMGVAVRLLRSEARDHYKSWWQHFRATPKVQAPPIPAGGNRPVPALISSDAVGHRISPEAVAALQDWRRTTCPEVSTSGLIAAATHRALTRNGIEMNPDGFFTLVDLRRYLPEKQALRPGNIVKSVFIPACMNDPSDVGAGIKEAVSSARAIPALAIGALSSGLRPGSRQPAISESAYSTMTFNYMMRLPGTDHIPWRDLGAARFSSMSYPCTPDNLAIFACGVAGAVHFSASFVPEVIDKSAVRNALQELDDIPALLAPESADVGLGGDTPG